MTDDDNDNDDNDDDDLVNDDDYDDDALLYRNYDEFRDIDECVTNQLTHRRTDTANHRDARTHLKEQRGNFGNIETLSSVLLFSPPFVSCGRFPLTP